MSNPQQTVAPYNKGSPYEGINPLSSTAEVVDARGNSSEQTWYMPQQIVTSTLVVGYPSEFFNAQKKPVVKVLQKDTEGSCWESIKASWAANRLSVEEVTTFLVELFSELVTEPIDKKWESFGIEIAKEKTSPKFQDIVDVQSYPAGRKIGTGPPPAELDKICIAIILMSPYRSNPTHPQNYKTELAARIGNLSKGYTPPGVANYTLKGFMEKYADWEQDQYYSRAIAAFDMLMMKDINHAWSKARICSVTSRFKDCSSLLSYQFFLDTLGMNRNEMLMWVWTEPIADDLRRIFRKGQEVDKMDSYTPYCASMRLIQKSPYSASINQSFHYFVHLTCALLGHERSKNSRNISTGNIVDPLMNAIVFSYARKSRVPMQAQFAEKGNVEALRSLAQVDSDDEEEDTGDMTLKEPEILSGIAWRRYMEGLNFKIPDKMINSAKGVCANFAKARQYSIGEYLYNWGGSTTTET